MKRGQFWAVAPLVTPAMTILVLFFGTLSVMIAYSFLPSTGMGQVGEGFTLENYQKFLGNAFYLSYVSRSLVLSLYCTAITLVLGYLVAYVMYRASPTACLIIGLILVVQFFTAYVIRTYAIMLILGRNGAVNKLLLNLRLVDEPLQLIFNELGVAIGMVLVSIPFMALPIYSSLHVIPRDLESAAHSLGATPFKCFWTIILPLSLPGIAAGIIIVYLFQITAYIIPGLLGGGYFDMVANLIYNKAMGAMDYPLSASASVTMLVISSTIVYAAQKLFAWLGPRT
jgi:ABC-type spermidine/putrescine transport system permease subunit I